MRRACRAEIRGVRVNRSSPSRCGDFGVGADPLQDGTGFPEGTAMTTTEAILQRLQALPEATRQEILDSAEFLEMRRYSSVVRGEDHAWSAFTLASARRGMEDAP